MKKFIFFFLMTLFLSCADSSVIDPPKNLIAKGEMAEIMAEMALNEQAYSVNQNANIENGTKFILNKHHKKGQDFTDSYQYYTITKKMEGILKRSMKIIREKDPSAGDYIDKKLKSDGNLQPFVR